MAAVTPTVITVAGRQAIVADLAGAAELVITHVAVGDAAGLPYDPNENQLALVGEKYRAGVASVAVSAGVLYVDAVVPPDTPDASGRPSHGFTIHEAGIYGTSGGVTTLLAVARMGGGYKPSPASGQSMTASFRLGLAVANPASITVVIDPQAQVALGREVRPQWITVDGVLDAPPAAPAKGATYVIGPAPTGAWAGFAGRLAQWVGVWSLASVPKGHVISNRGMYIGSPERYLRFDGSVWVSAAAKQDIYGVTRMATLAEAQAGVADDVALSPAMFRQVAFQRLSVSDFYVDGATGDDADDGLTPTKAFRTIQGAINGISSRYMTSGLVTVHVAPGAYAGFSVGASSVQQWRLSASGAAIAASSLAVNGGRGVVVSGGALVEIVGATSAAVCEAYAASGAHLTLRDCSVAMTNFSGISTIGAYAKAELNIFGTLGVDGSGATLFSSSVGSLVQLGYHDPVSTEPLVVTFAPGVAMNLCALATDVSVIYAHSPVVSWAGSPPTGQRFLSAQNSLIQTWGAGPLFFPGSIAGVTDTISGGRYA